MDDLEIQLKRALAREDPPEGFEGRVLARTRLRRSAPRWLAAAAAVLLIAGGGYSYRWREGQMAKQKVLLALRITSAKLSRIQAEVAR
jgi:hypothetical protein